MKKSVRFVFWFLVRLFSEDEGHLKVIRVQKYQVLFRKPCAIAFGLVAKALMPDAINY